MPRKSREPPKKPTHLGLARSRGGGQGGGVSAGRQATVLVLEPNAAVQELIDQALRESGHRVLSTGNSLEALELVRRVRIDVLVVGDVAENHTETLVSELRSSQPSLEVVSVGGRDNALSLIELRARLSSPVSLDDL